MRGIAGCPHMDGGPVSLLNALGIALHVDDAGASDSEPSIQALRVQLFWETVRGEIAVGPANIVNCCLERRGARPGPRL